MLLRKKQTARVLFAHHVTSNPSPPPSVSPRDYARVIKILMSIRETRRSQSSRRGGIKSRHFLDLSYLRAHKHDFALPQKLAHNEATCGLVLGHYEDF